MHKFEQLRHKFPDKSLASPQNIPHFFTSRILVALMWNVFASLIIQRGYCYNYYIKIIALNIDYTVIWGLYNYGGPCPK